MTKKEDSHNYLSWYECPGCGHRIEAYIRPRCHECTIREGSCGESRSIYYTEMGENRR